MSEGRPHLRAVPGEKAGEGASPVRALPRRGRLLVALLAAVAVICGVGWALQARETAETRSALEVSRAEANALRAELAAREARLQGARERTAPLVEETARLAERVRDLSAWLGAGEAGSAVSGAGGGAEAPETAAPGAEEEPVAPAGETPF